MMLKSKQGFRSLGQMECTMVDPCALLWHLCATSHGFSDFMEGEMERTPPIQRQPWSIVLYSDEVSPGNQLARLDMRCCSERVFKSMFA